LINSGILKYKE